MGGWSYYCKPLLVRFDEETKYMLERLAQEGHQSEAELVRWAVNHVFDQNQKAKDIRAEHRAKQRAGRGTV